MRRNQLLHNHLLTVAVLAVASLQLAACQQVSGRVEPEQPYQLKKIEGSKLSQVILTERAIERLGLKTDQVREEKVTRKKQMVGERRVVPYSAVIYDPQGQTWVYTSPSARTFVRHKIEIDFIEGDKAVLKDGPPAGTIVASVAVAEIYGTEFKMGK